MRNTATLFVTQSFRVGKHAGIGETIGRWGLGLIERAGRSALTTAKAAKPAQTMKTIMKDVTKQHPTGFWNIGRQAREVYNTLVKNYGVSNPGFALQALQYAPHAAVGAGVLGTAGLGYGLARWTQPKPWYQRMFGG